MSDVLTIRCPPAIKPEWVRESIGTIVGSSWINGQLSMSFTYGGMHTTACILPYTKSTRATTAQDILITTNSAEGRRVHKNAASLGFRRIIHYNPGGKSTTKRIVGCNAHPVVLSAEMVATTRAFLAEYLRMILYPTAADVNTVVITGTNNSPQAGVCSPECSGRHVQNSCLDRDGDVIMFDKSG